MREPYLSRSLPFSRCPSRSQTYSLEMAHRLAATLRHLEAPEASSHGGGDRYHTCVAPAECRALIQPRYSEAAPRGLVTSEEELPAVHLRCAGPRQLADWNDRVNECVLGVGVWVRRLREASRSGATFDVAWRLKQLERLQTMITNHRQQLIDAVRLDLGEYHA